MSPGASRPPPSVRCIEALHGLLLRLLPRPLRRRHGRAMRTMIRRLLMEAHRSRGAPGVVRVGAAILADLLLFVVRPSGPRAHRRGRAPGRADLHDPLAATRERGGFPVLPFLSDLRVAARSLSKRPTLTVVATFTFAMGLGAVTSVFSVVWGAWLKPLPYPEADRLVQIGDVHQSFEPGVYATVSVGDYVDMKEGNRTFESTTIFTFAMTTLGEGEEERPVTALYAEPTLFRTLGVPPALGRDLTPEDRSTERRVAILAHDFWVDAFGGSRDVLGTEVDLFGRPWTVVGVGPEDFDLPREVDVVIPFYWSEAQRNDHGGRSMRAVGRVAPGVSLDAARADLQAIYAGIAERYPENHVGWTVGIGPFREQVVGREHTALRLMSWAAALLLVITCANVASLLLARAEGRKREVAVRAALGAGRARIVSSFLGESLILGILGGILGVGVAVLGIDLLVTIFGGSLRRPSEIGLNGATLTGALAATLSTSVVVGLIPGSRLDVSRLGEALKEGGRGGIRSGILLRKGIVVTEIALAVLLVSGAGLLLNTMWRLGRADMGFEPEGGVAVFLDLPDDRYAEPSDQARLFRGLAEAVERSPAVVAVGAGDRVPPDGNLTANGFAAAGRPDRTVDFVVTRQVAPGYFRAAGIDFLEGGPVGWLDPPPEGDDGGDPPVVINRTLAAALFPERSAVGRLVADGERRHRVAGVVEAVHQRGAGEPAPPAVYYPWPAVPLSFATRPVLVLRAAEAGEDGRGAALAALRRSVETIDPAIRFTSRPLEEGLQPLYREQEFALALMGVFAVLALVLGVVGIYGVVSFTVAQQTREVGIRIALGANRAQVVGGVLRQGVGMALAGVTVGLVAAAALGRFTASLLYGVSPVDGGTYGAVAVLFLGTAALAAFVPARRAARIQPTEALQIE